MGKLFVELTTAKVALDASRGCPVARLLSGPMETEDRDALKDALASDLHATKIRAILGKVGYTLSRDAIPEHRRQACACYTNEESR